MAIRKHEFYEGAALHQLARAGRIHGIRHEPPFFLVNDRFLLHLKYSTKGRSPWGFTFTPDERGLLEQRANGRAIVIGLVCGGDGIAAVTYDAFSEIAGVSDGAIHIACYRRHGEHYAVAGPGGALDHKVPPSLWQRLLEN